MRNHEHIEKLGVRHVLHFKFLDLERSQIMEKLETHENIEKFGVRHVLHFKFLDLGRSRIMEK